MRHLRLLQAWIWFLIVAAGPAWSSQTPQIGPYPPLVAPLALVGGTLIDVTNWGRSARDLHDSIVIVDQGKIVAVGARADLPIPLNARVVDCTGKYLIPGLIDGFAGMNSQGQASAFLYMGVTTVVASADARRGHIDMAASPKPHIYLLDSIGTTDDWSLLIGQPGWAAKLRESTHPVELSPDDTARQLEDTAHLGTRVLWIGTNITAANTQWIVTHARQLGIATYGEFAATPYNVGIGAGVDVLLHMGRYELGVIPDELQRPLVEDPAGPAATTAYDYAEHLPPGDVHVRTYARFIATHHAALMPTFSLFFQRLPDHRNLWHEPAAALLDPANIYDPPDRATGEMTYPLSSWQKHLPAIGQRYFEEGQQKRADQSAMRFWQINETIFNSYPHYLAASGAPVMGSFPGISEHVELEMLVRLGLSAREALAAATNNYAMQLGWTELGLIAPGRRADILVLDSDPTANVWNARRITTLILDGNLLDRESLLRLKK